MLAIDWSDIIDWNEIDDTLSFKFGVMLASCGLAIVSLILLAISLTLFGGNEDRPTKVGMGYGFSNYGFNASKKSIVAFAFGVISMVVGGILIWIGWESLREIKNN